jgi:signal transduction histidine kinase/sugar lactone lactonase YvrE
VGDDLRSISEHDNGEILVATSTGLRRLVGGRLEGTVLPAAQQRVPVQALLRDREGALWIGTPESGLLRAHNGRIDAFSRFDGLSGDAVSEIFEDREGNIWVTTLGGLDRFRQFAAATQDQGLSSASVDSVLETSDGSIWIGTGVGLNRWHSGEVAVYREQADGTVQRVLRSALQPPVLEERESGVTDSSASLYEDRRGRLWIGALGGVGYLEDERIVRVRGVPGGLIDSFAEDRSGNLWIAHRGEGLFRLSSDDEIERTPWAELTRGARLGREDWVARIAGDPHRGGLWLGFRSGGVSYFSDGEIRTTYSAADGLADGFVRHVRVDAGGVVWVATEGGLSRIDGGRIATLRGRNGLPCDIVDWTVEDDLGSIWLYMACGIVRVDRAELDAWAVAADGIDPELRLSTVRVFDRSDGVQSQYFQGTYAPHVAKSRDGKLWFKTERGVSVVDPSHLPYNALPPPVHIEQIVADRAPYDIATAVGAVRLPALVRDLRIDYTALSLIAPEKVLFRYRLERHDDAWQDAGTRRQAFYTDLPPGDYRFRVIASNNDGVWNEEGASVQFSIAPTFYQTRWFAVLCIAAAAGILAVLYVLRARQIEARVAMRLNERLAERERIARDLHDTFLQSVQGLMLKFQAVMARMPRDAPSRLLLQAALDRADEVLAEGRDRVYELRGSADSQDLPQALTAVAADLTPNVPTEFRITVEGSPRRLHPVVREEAFLIGAEALRNAFRHAAARHINLEIEYTRQGLSLRVVDDGRGFDVTALSENAPKHFGLIGLRERARKIRSRLEVSSLQGSGTEVRLRVPAAVAFVIEGRTKDFTR